MLNTGHIIPEDENEKDIYIKNFRKNLANKKYAASCKQEMYDYTIKEIIEEINDVNSYFDPKFFINLLEIKFNCNIFIFQRNINNDINLIIPRHIKGYYKNLRNKKCIFIYEHLGTKNENLEYYQCERIVFWNENSDEYLSTINYDSIVCKCINKIYKKLNITYILNRLLTTNILPNIKTNIEVKFISQYIDYYGKCRMLNFNYKDHFGTLITDPLQPFFLKKIKKYKIDRIDYKYARKICDILNIINIKYIIKNETIKSITGNFIKSDVKVIIPVTYTNKEKIILKSININQDNSIKYLENNNSDLQNFNKYKKLARCIQEYIFWLYSKYIIEDNINTDNYSEFIEKYIQIIPDFKYKKVKKTFSMKSGVMNNKKLIIKSKETLNRLMYGLKLYKIRNRKKLSEYYNFEFIQNYYNDISDFDNFHYQIILQGENSIKKWIKQKNNYNYYLYDHIKINKISITYFLDIFDLYYDTQEDIKKISNIDYLIENNDINFIDKILHEIDNINYNNLKTIEDDDIIYFPEFNPYFFKNNLIDNNIFLVQATYNLNKAIKICKVWDEKEYNIGSNVKLNKEEENYKNTVSYIIYAYENPKNIKSYKISSKYQSFSVNDNEIFKILMFKNLNNEILYLSLLPIKN